MALIENPDAKFGQQRSRDHFEPENVAEDRRTQRALYLLYYISPPTGGTNAEILCQIDGHPHIEAVTDVV